MVFDVWLQSVVACHYRYLINLKSVSGKNGTTDGMENASRQYSYKDLKRMIERQKEKYGWEFLFLGVNIDAAKEAARFGINADRAANYHADHQGTGVIYETVSDAIGQVRQCYAPLQADWKARIDEDYEKRGN